jgi:hypothetical protein
MDGSSKINEFEALEKFIESPGFQGKTKDEAFHLQRH